MELIILALMLQSSLARPQQSRSSESFQAEIFLNNDDLNSGLYEGTVKGRRLFTSSAVPHGNGTIYYFNNDKFHRANYTGQWVDGHRHGNGTTYFKDGSFYSGQYEDGVEEGLGVITYNDGNVLEGEFSNGKINGHAVFRYPNGDRREGFFVDNVLNGQVIFTKLNGKITIELWKDGKKLPEHEQVVRGDGEKSTSTTEKTDVSTDGVDLTQFKLAVRSNEKSQLFFSEGKNQQRPRQPKVNDGKVAVETDRLRKETEDNSRDFLFSVFQLVNG